MGLVRKREDSCAEWWTSRNCWSVGEREGARGFVQRDCLFLKPHTSEDLPLLTGDPEFTREFQGANRQGQAHVLHEGRAVLGPSYRLVGLHPLAIDRGLHWSREAPAPEPIRQSVGAEAPIEVSDGNTCSGYFVLIMNRHRQSPNRTRTGYSRSHSFVCIRRSRVAGRGPIQIACRSPVSSQPPYA